MADQAETTIALVAPTTGTGAGIFTATVTTADTVTLGNFGEVLNGLIVKIADNSNVTFTKATNVLTITQALLAADKVLIYAQGT